MLQGSSTGAENETDDDTDSSSKLSMHSVQDALSAFRQEWQKELKDPNKTKTAREIEMSAQLEQCEDKEEKAKTLFCKGVEYEQSGNMYDAIQYYRKAVQIIPDIEFRMYQNIQKITFKDDVNKSVECENRNLDQFEDLLSHIRNIRDVTDPVCSHHKEPSSTHISQLPVEIILYILRWVVSSELDLRSLEQCAAVCRGFYILSRDSEIWRMACVKTWGINCGVLKNSPYSSWRQMILERPRLRFNGCYISKTTYFRYGENNFQDQFYRPWHLIEYYRYLRFFPGGRVLMLTTPDEPVNIVYSLKSWPAKNNAIMSGHYRIHQDHVIVVVKRAKLVNKIKEYGRQRKRKEAGIDTGDQTFQVELQINSSQKRNSNQLTWFAYTVLCKNYNGTESHNTFDLISTRYPPFWFSRVKSYHAESESPLQ